MNYFRCFTVIGTAVVRATLWLVNGFKSIGNVVPRHVPGRGSLGGTLLWTAGRHPIVWPRPS